MGTKSFCEMSEDELYFNLRKSIDRINTLYNINDIKGLELYRNQNKTTRKGQREEKQYEKTKLIKVVRVSLLTGISIENLFNNNFTDTSIRINQSLDLKAVILNDILNIVKKNIILKINEKWNSENVYLPICIFTKSGKKNYSKLGSLIGTDKSNMIKLFNPNISKHCEVIILLKLGEIFNIKIDDFIDRSTLILSCQKETHDISQKK